MNAATKCAECRELRFMALHFVDQEIADKMFCIVCRTKRLEWYEQREHFIESFLSDIGSKDTWGMPTGRDEYEAWLKENPKP